MKFEFMLHGNRGVDGCNLRTCEIEIVKNYIVISGFPASTNLMEVILKQFCLKHNININDFKVLESLYMKDLDRKENCYSILGNPIEGPIWTNLTKEEFHSLINYER